MFKINLETNFLIKIISLIVKIVIVNVSNLDISIHNFLFIIKLSY